MTETPTMDTARGASARLAGMPMTGRVTLITALCLCVFLFCGPCVANAGGTYVGLGFGAARSTVDNGSVEFGTLDYTPDVAIWRLLAGYQVTDHIGIEGGYISLGKARVETQGGDFFETTVTGFELTPVGILPVGKGSSMFVRGGIVVWNSDISYRFTALGSGSEKKSGNDFLLSFGARYSITRMIGVRAEYSRYIIDKGKAGAGDDNVITFNGMVSF